MKKQIIGGAAAIGVAASLVLAAPAAYAEPVGDGYTVVGSDTLEIAMDLLANGTNVSGPNVRVLASDGSTVDNFAATGSTNIVAKPYGSPFYRPNGSSDGHRALSRSIDGTAWKLPPGVTGTGPTISGQVDIARVSSMPTTGSGAPNATGPIAAIPFGRDALAYATNNSALNNLTSAQIEQLFECTATGTINGVPVSEIVPVIPQSGSGTRSSFLSLHRITEGTLGACVQTGQEHESRYIYTSSAATATVAPPANTVMAMSTVQWILQKNIPAYNRIGAGFEIYSHDPANPTPVDVNGAVYGPNAAFYASAAGRDTSLLVEYARIDENDAKFDAVLADLLGGTKLGDVTTSFLPADVMSVKQALGFGVPQVTTISRYNTRTNG